MDNQYHFYKLTPSDDVEMGIYEKAMEYVFSNKDIRNIAISGAYGAGKSSMLESYKKEHPDKKFIHISLAHFTSTTAKDAEDNKEDDGKEKREIALEGKIINQLVHQINPQKVPLTNFRIKKDMDKRHILKVSLLITAFIAITCFLRFKSIWENMINGFSIDIFRKLLGFTTTKEVEFVLGTVALIILAIAIYEVIKLQKSVRLFRKLIFQGNQIEIFEESKDSYFDKYLNEVLYIFKHADVDGIIFEDIDRYNTNVIFEKLREINFLLNSKERAEDENKSGKVIRFFYLLRDDIFESKDRTKFFDFILPIVPVVDASNAYDKFIDYFKKANLLELFDMELVQRLSLYVDDMRVLKNICNEFIIYHERLKTSFTEQGNSKLLAIIVYKNLFPKDFSSLQVGRGYVYTLFAEKKSLVRDKIEQLKKEIIDLKAENEQIKSELRDDLDELNSIYFVIDGKISVDGREETAYQTRREFVKAILQSENVAQYYNRYGEWRNISIEDQRNAMEQNEEYAERKLLIEKKNNGKISKNNLHIARLEKQIGECEHVFLKDILTRENETTVFKTNYKNVLDEIEEFAEVKRSPYFDLIKMLIREGYLDETYPDYMTYFYENSITANDKTFVRSVTDRRKKPFDYHLDNAALVVSRMRVLDFKEPEALNFELLENLLSDTEKYKEQLQNFLENIRNIKPVEFVSEFLERKDIRKDFRKDFVKEFNTYWSGATKWILLDDGFSKQQKRNYVIVTFCVSSDEVIIDHNGEKAISKFIEGEPTFLSILPADKENLKNKLKLLKIKFKNIKTDTADSELLRFVYENNMYQINMEMIQEIIKKYYAVEYVLGKNLSIILSREDEPLCNYIRENIDLYMSVLLSETQETDDTEEVVLYVLNNSEITEDNMRSYIVSMKEPIPCLRKVESAQWRGELLIQDKVQHSIDNLYDYYLRSENGLDENLIHYINGFDFSFKNLIGNFDNEYGEGAGEKFFRDIVKENEIINDKYEGIVCAFGLKCEILPQNEIASDKIEILINRDVLEMNADTLAVMREYYPEKCITFILKNIERYVALINRTMFLSSEMLQLLEEDISDELKIQLLKFETNPISIQDKKYSAKVEDYIVEHLYSSKDFQYLMQWYPSNRVQLQKLIREMAIVAISNGEEIPFAVHTKLFEQLVQDDQLYNEDKQSLLINQIKMGVTKGAVRFAFERLGLIEYKEILEGRPGKVPVTEINEQLLEALQERKWIAGYKEDTDDPELFYVYGKAVRKKKDEVSVGA